MPTARTGPSLSAAACRRGDRRRGARAACPRLVDLYQTELLIYGLTFAIAALGFNLLLGYTGLLSFGHSAYFGTGAYAVAFIMRDLSVHSMELCILGGVLSTFVISALFGYVCVRHTRIFFSILALALVAGAVEPRLQVLLGDRRHRRHPRAAQPDHAAGRPRRFHGLRRRTRNSSMPITTTCWSCSWSRSRSCG